MFYNGYGTFVSFEILTFQLAVLFQKNEAFGNNPENY